MGKGKPSEIWKEIKPRIGDMVTAANDMEQSFDKAVKEAYDKGYTDAAYNCHERCAFLDAEKQESYRCGLRDAWEAARKICLEEDDGGIPASAINDIFNVRNYRYAVKDYSASEAVEKIQAYEQKQDRQARIKFNCDEIKDVLNTTMKECNVSLDDIAEVLQKMKENVNG